MDANQLLSQMTIPNPCSMEWGGMRGDDRTRHCASCGKNVNDLTAMSADAAAALLQSNNDGVCVRVCKGIDGTLRIPGCEQAPAQNHRPWQFRIRTLMAVVAGVAAGLGLGKLFSMPEEELVPQSAFLAPSEPSAPRNLCLQPGHRLVLGMLASRSAGETVSSDQYSRAGGPLNERRPGREEQARAWDRRSAVRP
jgi:hypothetical protein